RQRELDIPVVNPALGIPLAGSRVVAECLGFACTTAKQKLSCEAQGELARADFKRRCRSRWLACFHIHAQRRRTIHKLVLQHVRGFGGIPGLLATWITGDTAPLGGVEKVSQNMRDFGNIATVELRSDKCTTS